MTEKIVGYLLLVVGVVVILLSAANAYQVFTRRAEPVRPFDFNGLSLDLSSTLTASLPPELQAATRQTKAAPVEIISAEMINETSNLFAHLVLMGFVAGAGQKLASLGVNLVRPIVVKAKEEKINS